MLGPFPPSCIGLFLVRDGLTIASAFNVPPILAAALRRWAENGAEAEGPPGGPLLGHPQPAPTIEGSKQPQQQQQQQHDQQQEKQKQGHTRQQQERPQLLLLQYTKHHPPQQPQQQQQQQQQQEQKTPAAYTANVREGPLPMGPRSPSIVPLYCNPLSYVRWWLWSDPRTPASVAQLLSPVAVQLFSTPLHLLALEIYNRPACSSTERLNTIKRTYIPAVLARIARIVPAFGLGGLVNTRTRQAFAAVEAELTAADEINDQINCNQQQ